MSAQSGAEPGLVPYRGEDRRRVARPVASPIGLPYVLAILITTLTAAVLIFGVTVLPGWVVQAQELVQVLQVVSLMVAVAVGGLAISRWYLTSDASALWIGISLLL